MTNTMTCDAKGKCLSAWLESHGRRYRGHDPWDLWKSIYGYQAVLCTSARA
jgi:hypothetical protein